MKIEKWSIGTVPYKSVIKNFENIIVRNLWRSIFIIKCTVYSLQSFILLKMRLWLISFPWNFTFVYHYILRILNFRKIYLFYWHARDIWLFSGTVEQILNLLRLTFRNAALSQGPILMECLPLPKTVKLFTFLWLNCGPFILSYFRRWGRGMGLEYPTRWCWIWYEWFCSKI